MEYSVSLERRLKVKENIDRIESFFDKRNNFFKNPRNLLRNIKMFLHENEDEIKDINQNSKLNSTDCLTLAVIANLLANRKGVKSKIVRPNNLTHYLHAMLEYSTEENKSEIFKLTGRNKNYFSVIYLSPGDIERRLNYIRPVVNFVNYIRGI